MSLDFRTLQNTADTNFRATIPRSNESCVNVRVDGVDAEAFLQGQLTVDVTTLLPGQARIGALCNPQGRVSAVFDLLRLDDHFQMVVPGCLAEAIVHQLQRYVLRSKVRIVAADDTGLFSARYDEQSMLSSGTCVHDHDHLTYTPNWLPRGWLFATTDAAAAAATTPAQPCWRQARVVWGIALPNPQTQNLFLPQMLNLDALGGVSYDKGCYTGQEIIARTHFRGTVKRRLGRYLLGQQEATRGTVDYAQKILKPDGAQAGTIVEWADDDSGNTAVLAVIRLDAADACLSLGAATLHPWALPAV